MKYNIEDIIMYLNDIDNYVNSILLYHSCSDNLKKELDLKEILMYLSSVSEIISRYKKLSL